MIDRLLMWSKLMLMVMRIADGGDIKKLCAVNKQSGETKKVDRVYFREIGGQSDKRSK